MGRACVPSLYTAHYKAQGFDVASNLVGHLAIARQMVWPAFGRPDHLPL
jgi:hypothetical protein